MGRFKSDRKIRCKENLNKSTYTKKLRAQSFFKGVRDRAFDNPLTIFDTHIKLKLRGV